MTDHWTRPELLLLYVAPLLDVISDLANTYSPDDLWLYDSLNHLSSRHDTDDMNQVLERHMALQNPESVSPMWEHIDLI